MEPKFKKGDWCFSEFELKQVREVDSGHIISVTNGYVCTSGPVTDISFPLDLRIKTISETFQEAEKALRALSVPRLNWPDLHRWMVEKWVEACIRKENSEAVGKIYESLKEMVEKIKEESFRMKLTSVNGVSLFR